MTVTCSCLGLTQSFESKSTICLLVGTFKSFFSSSTFSTDATIKLYTTSSIQELVEPRLTGDAFTTIAVCCGGDYDKVMSNCESFVLLTSLFRRAFLGVVARRLLGSFVAWTPAHYVMPCVVITHLISLCNAGGTLLGTTS